MIMKSPTLNAHASSQWRAAATLSVAFCLVILAGAVAAAHPLGNFSINYYARLEVAGDRARVRYIVDMAEIPTLQESEKADADRDGSTSSAELNAYLETVSARYQNGLQLTIESVRVPLEFNSKKITRLAGAGGLSTLRIECDLEGVFPSDTQGPRRLRLEDSNDRDRLGWREMVVVPLAGVNIFDSTAYGNGLTDELKAYPEDRLAAPLDETAAELSFTRGHAPWGSNALRMRDGRTIALSRDRFVELIAVPRLTAGVALVGLLLAAGLGALHAFSPGHGKTVVGAYLIGSRGTARHAAFLGLTVTVTHTAGVYALGLVTLFASQYILPEKLFPVLSLVSGAIVLVMGLGLFVRRLRATLSGSAHEHEHGHNHTHPHLDDHAHEHEGEDTRQLDGGAMVHSHGGSQHSHLPPGAGGNPVTWRSLLALGISGGLLPCPSALVVLLSAIALHRVGYGLLLIVAFSLGLASALTAIGLVFVYAGRWVKRPTGRARWLVPVLPIVSALVIAGVGAVICYEALVQSGIRFTHLAPNSFSWTTSALAFGFVIGLKHAMEADHLAAVSTIVSEQKSLVSASLVGGLWGVGHTISLLVAGLAVILFHIEIGTRMEMALEFGVALMLIALGVNAIRKLRRGSRIHFHAHRHGERVHFHPHVHDGSPDVDPDTHHGSMLGTRPLLVGMMHGLAGSAALMLLVLSTIKSPLVGLAYIVVFGLGSIGGMMAMSVLVGLPLRFTARRFARVNLMLRGLAGLASLSFGVFMVYELGFVQGLLR